MGAPASCEDQRVIVLAPTATDVIAAVAAVVGTAIAVGKLLPAIIRWWRRRAKPPSADEAANEQTAASAQFGQKLLAIVEEIKQFRPWPRSAFDEDMKKFRAFNTELVLIGKQRVRQAFNDRSVVAQIEQAVRYGVDRAIGIIQSHRLDPPPAGDQSSAQQKIVGESWLVLEHAYEVFRENAEAAQQRPLDVKTEFEELSYGFWKELEAFAEPARSRSPRRTA